MQQAIDMRQRGVSIQSIADLLGTSYNKVYYYLLKRGLAGENQRPSPIDYDELYQWFADGGNIRQFCIAKGIKRSTYYHYMTRDWGSTDKDSFMENYDAF